ncbi:hypothetical protein A2J04_05565 [Rhodococcus sp. EPR-279]|nr:hypothetical protein A2J02_26870 [Rhodococcus sp. EPR-147]KZF04800.1 hypothetical protein A2J04_05565 [Rhodococcus sp. EPR-279]
MRRMLTLIFIAVCAIGYYLYRRDHPRPPIERGPVNQVLTYLAWAVGGAALVVLFIYNLPPQS